MLTPLFCSGKGDKRQIDPGHFIFFNITQFLQDLNGLSAMPPSQFLGTAQICDRDFSFEAMFSTKRAKKKLSLGLVIGLQVVYPGDRLVCYALPQLNYDLKLSLLVWWCVCVGGGGGDSCLETGKY